MTLTGKTPHLTLCPLRRTDHFIQHLNKLMDQFCHFVILKIQHNSRLSRVRLLFLPMFFMNVFQYKDDLYKIHLLKHQCILPDCRLCCLSSHTVNILFRFQKLEN